MRLITLLGVLACCATAASASAQATAAQATFGQVRAKGSPTVFVTDRSGQESSGQLITFSESEITIKTTAGPKTFTADQVSLIERKGDSLKNGAIIGTVVGLVASVLFVPEICSGKDHGCVGPAIAGVVYGTAIYAAIGAGIDAAVPGRTRIWPAGAPAHASGAILSISPRDHRAFIGWKIR